MRQLLHIFGPFSIHPFGLFIAAGIMVFSVLFLRDPRRKKIICNEQFFSLLSACILLGFAGGRLLYVFSNWHQLPSFWHLFAVWEGGFSLLGGIMALLVALPFLLKKERLAPFPLLDIVSTYAPLLQSISRIGCFFAGCCYGIARSCVLPEALHPTQLYSAAALFGIFLFLFFWAQTHLKKWGQTTALYLFLMALERFMVDFWRADREFGPLFDAFSIAQLIALLIMIGSSISLIFICTRTREMP